MAAAAFWRTLELCWEKFALQFQYKFRTSRIKAVPGPSKIESLQLDPVCATRVKVHCESCEPSYLNMHNYLSYRYPVKEISQRKNSDTTCDRELVLKQFDAKVFSGTSKGIRFRRQNQRRLKNECTNRWVINVTLHFPFSFGCC